MRKAIHSSVKKHDGVFGGRPTWSGYCTLDAVTALLPAA